MGCYPRKEKLNKALILTMHSEAFHSTPLLAHLMQTISEDGPKLGDILASNILYQHVHGVANRTRGEPAVVDGTTDGKRLDVVGN